MADQIEEILRQLKRDQAVLRTRFTSGFLNNVGDVLDRDGFGATKTFLIEKLERRDLRPQAETILNVVLPKLEAEPAIRQRRSLGRYIIKTLETLKSQEVRL